MFDILIKNAHIVDGTGNPWFRGHVGVRGDRIAALGSLIDYQSIQTLDADGLVLSPGFIDAHLHTDAILFSEPRHSASLYQGVTTHIIGQDGMSFAPASRQTIDYMNEYAAALNDQFNIDTEYLTVRDYLNSFDRRTSVNIAYLVPHGCLRMEAMGLDDRLPTSTELAHMQKLANQAMADGAVGFSTGLEYVPCLYADVDELAAIGQAVAPWGGVFVVHLRHYTREIEAAFEEALSVGIRAGIGVHISHLMGQGEVLLPLLDVGRSRGVDVTFDAYPYLAGCTTLSKACLPAWVQSGGVYATAERLSQVEVRDRLRPWLESPDRRWDQLVFSNISSPEQRVYEGLTPKEAAHLANKSITDFVCDLLSANLMAVGVIEQHTHWRSEEDLRQLIRHRAFMMGSDGVFVGGHPHPRGWGAIARSLGTYTRDLGVFELEDIVRRLSSHAAQRFGLRDRGLIREGYVADMVVFDLEKIRDRSTFQNGRQLAEGMVHVMVNGRFVLRDGIQTEALPGRALRPYFRK